MSWFYHLPDIVQGLAGLGLAGVWFFVLAVVVKGRARAVADARSARGEVTTNLILWTLDALAITPLLALLTAFMLAGMTRLGLVLPTGELWRRIGPVGTGLAIVFTGDFVGYWRHRLEHTPWLWPAHAVHHSDRDMTWLTLERMHPVDRLVSSMDTLILAGLGFPLWALGINIMVRHYWGYMIHTDAPWTLGPAQWVINSPAMHRWHHCRDERISGRNFATVFSVFDRLFGTLHAPGPCDAPLGVEADMGRGWMGQYLYPLRIWLRLADTAFSPDRRSDSSRLTPTVNPTAD